MFTNMEKRHKMKMKCIIHKESVKCREIKPFSDTTWSKLKQCIEQWSKLDGNDKILAENNLKLLDKELLALESQEQGLGYHKPCYIRFTDKTKIAAAEKRVEKRLAGTHIRRRNPKKLRPENHVPKAMPTVKSFVRPPITDLAACIICTKEQSYVTNFERKRVRDKLLKAKTPTAGTLLEAAHLKKDEPILSHIEDKDCSVIEVRYHAKCYSKYVRCVGDKKKRDLNPVIVSPEDVERKRIYGKFCEEVIETSIINNNAMIHITKLCGILNDMLKKENNAFVYKNHGLKYHIQKDYPQLLFHASEKKNVSEIVYVENLLDEGSLQSYDSLTSTNVGHG